MFRKGKRKPFALFNTVPDGYFCPVCMNMDITLMSKDSWDDHYRCGHCGSAWKVVEGLDPDGYAEEVRYMTDRMDIEWDDCNDPLETMRLLAKRQNRVPLFIDDSEVIQWIRDYWSYVQWNEHGNGLTYGELYEEGGYTSILRDILRPEDLIEGITGGEPRRNWSAEQSDLIGRLERIHRRVAT